MKRYVLAGVVVNMKYRSPDSRIVGSVGAMSTMIIFDVSPLPPTSSKLTVVLHLVLPLPVPFDFYAN